MTDDEIDALIAEWHEAPTGTAGASVPLHRYLGWTWDEYRAWAEHGLRPGVRIDTNRSMVPMSGSGLRRECGGCGHEIAPFEAYQRGRHTGVLWCDSCNLADREAE